MNVISKNSQTQWIDSISNVDAKFCQNFFIVFDEMLLNLSLKRKKQNLLLVKQIWFCNVLEKNEWFQYRVLVEILKMKNLKNWFEIWISKC